MAIINPEPNCQGISKLVAPTVWFSYIAVSRFCRRHARGIWTDLPFSRILNQLTLELICHLVESSCGHLKQFVEIVEHTFDEQHLPMIVGWADELQRLFHIAVVTGKFQVMGKCQVTRKSPVTGKSQVTRKSQVTGNSQVTRKSLTGKSGVTRKSQVTGK